MRVVSIVGARPQFIKLAALATALSDAGHDHVVVHTGQHYDDEMSDLFFRELDLPAPAVNLGLGGGSAVDQVGRMLPAIEKILRDTSPDWVLVYGDTNSTLAGALCARQLHLPVAHVEAGLRSFNRRMPEELNRTATDHIADLLLAPSERSRQQLELEGLADRAAVVGDVMLDVLLRISSTLAEDLESREFYLATIHRAENTDDPQRLAEVLSWIQNLDLPVVLPAHPRLCARAEEAGLVLGSGAVQVVEPVGYFEMLSLAKRAKTVLTDSGGLQKEAVYLGTKTLTLRAETEWIETLEAGWNRLVGSADELQAGLRMPVPSEHFAAYGDGSAGKASVAAMEQWG